MDQIRLGTVGSGFIVHYILDNVMITPGISLEAVYSRSQEKGEALAREYGAEKVYTDMDAFLADPEVNFVYIATPNLLHYPQAKKALLAGKNVILEKPFTTKLEHAKELVQIAREKGLYLIDAVPTACLPNLEVIRDHLSEIGRIRLVMANYSQYSSRYDQVLAGEKPNVFNWEYAGGCLMDINFYNVYLNVSLFGRPAHGEYAPNVKADLGDTSGCLTLQYEDFVSQCMGAKDSWGVNFFQIQGEKGYIYASGSPSALESVQVVTREGSRTYDHQTEPNRWLYEVREITQRVLSGDRATFDARLDTMLVVIGTIESARLDAGICFPGDEENS